MISSSIIFSFLYISMSVGYSTVANTMTSPSPMTVAIFGASGLTASECIYQTINQGNNVIGLTRHPSNVAIPKGSGGTNAGKPFNHDSLKVIEGDATNPQDVQKVFSTHIDSVIIALGGKTADVGETMLTDSTNLVIDAMKTNGVKRMAVISSIGVGDSKKQAPLHFRVLMSTMMKRIFKDKNNQDKAVRLSGLEYCLVRPGGLTVDPPTGVINVINGQAGSISRADVARFCLDAISKKDFKYIGKAPCISSIGGTRWTKDRSAKARTG